MICGTFFLKFEMYSNQGDLDTDSSLLLSSYYWLHGPQFTFSRMKSATELDTG